MYKKLLFSILLALAITALALQSCSLEALHLVSTVHASSPTDITVYYINVGQGDSILIKVEDKTILIDGGPEAASATVLNFLSEVNVTNINLLVATHPHDDHIGGNDGCDADCVWLRRRWCEPSSAGAGCSWRIARFSVYYLVHYTRHIFVS